MVAAASTTPAELQGRQMHVKRHESSILPAELAADLCDLLNDIGDAMDFHSTNATRELQGRIANIRHRLFSA